MLDGSPRRRGGRRRGRRVGFAPIAERVRQPRADSVQFARQPVEIEGPAPAAERVAGRLDEEETLGEGGQPADERDGLDYVVKGVEHRHDAGPTGGRERRDVGHLESRVRDRETFGVRAGAGDGAVTVIHAEKVGAGKRRASSQVISPGPQPRSSTAS